MLTVALIVLLPQAPADSSQPDVVQLPFDLGNVGSSAFYPLVFAILAVFGVALASAHAQHMRIHKLAHGVVGDLASSYRPSVGTVHPRDLYDVLAVSGLTRVGPLAQWTRGRYQFARDEAAAPWGLRAVSTVYYLILKLLVFAVLFVIPVVALWNSYARVAENISGSWLILMSVAGLIAGLSLAVVFFGEAAYVFLVARLLSRSGRAEGASKSADL